MIEEILSSREPSLSTVDCSQSSIFPSDRQDKRFALRAAILHECQNLLGGGNDLGGSEKNFSPSPPPTAIIPDDRSLGTFENQNGHH